MSNEHIADTARWEIELCDGCFCMTKRTMEGLCGKCGTPKPPHGIKPCRHTEHAIRGGVGRVGRWFPEPYDGIGTWEPCEHIDGLERGDQ